MKPFRIKTEKQLTPVSLSGVLVPSSDYKLVSLSGFEYFIVADSQWEEVLPQYCWKEVKVIGLFNIANRTVIPQKIFPKGPTGEKENIINIPIWKNRKLAKKLVAHLSELVLVPAAICALMV